jgi:hypothetical protein
MQQLAAKLLLDSMLFGHFQHPQADDERGIACYGVLEADSSVNVQVVLLSFLIAQDALEGLIPFWIVIDAIPIMADDVTGFSWQFLV